MTKYQDQAFIVLMGEIMGEFERKSPNEFLLNTDGTLKTCEGWYRAVKAFLQSAMERVREETTKDVMKSFPKPDGNLNNSNWEKYIEKIDEWKADLLEEIQATSPEFIKAMEKEKKTKKRIPLKDVT